MQQPILAQSCATGARVLGGSLDPSRQAGYGRCMDRKPPYQEAPRGRLRAGSRWIERGRAPLVMGVVNVTPDSFSDGGRYLDAAAAVRHALQLVEDGADLLDVGGESTRPGAEPVPVDEELRRVLPVLRQIRSQTSIPLSIDTTKAEVAQAALEAGADIVNDVSGLRFDPALAPGLAGAACTVVLMHMQGAPRTMQDAPHYGDVVREVQEWLEARVAAAAAAGIARERIWVDPGVGFGKRVADNVEILQSLPALRVPGCALLVGASRKRFLGSLLDEPDPLRRQEGDLAVAARCFAAGADVLRVHDVREVRRFLEVLDAITPAP